MSDARFSSALDGIFTKLREIYTSRGYTRYRVGRFEEYDLYAKNRSFITGSSILTFTDTDGRLMALKPDVTLSVIKNTAPSRGLRKVYYCESVYRAADPSSGFSEIQQAGLECIGSLTLFDVCEVIELAAGSLAALSERYMLDLSHLGLLDGFLEDNGVPAHIRPELLRLAEEKNSHEAMALAEKNGVPLYVMDAFNTMIHLRAPLEEAVRRLSSLPLGERAAEALSELARVAVALRGVEGIYLDLSLRCDGRYYNGIVMRGYIPDVPSPVLSGGRYDGLTKRLHRDAGAMGFAVYLNLLDRLVPEPDGTDTDILILHNGSDPEGLLRAVRALTAEGKRVRTDTAAPEGFRFGKLLHYEGGELRE